MKEGKIGGKQLTETEKLFAGLAYDARDVILTERQNLGKKWMQQYNAAPVEDMAERQHILEKMLGHCGKQVRVNQPFYVDYGCNIYLGEHSFINMNCTFLDACQIIIGKNTLIGPDVKIYTVFHPMLGKERFWQHQDGSQTVCCLAKPVVIGNDSWIGGGSIILPGVTIGDDVVIGAGSVVTHDIPDHVVAFGNPCRVVRNNYKKIY